TSACWELSACEQRAMVRWASSCVMTLSSLSHCTMRRQSTGPRWEAAFRRPGASTEAVITKDLSRCHGLESPQPFGGRQVPARLDRLGPLGQLRALRPRGRALGQHHRVALARGLESPERLVAKGLR